MFHCTGVIIYYNVKYNHRPIWSFKIFHKNVHYRVSETTKPAENIQLLINITSYLA